VTVNTFDEITWRI